MYECTYRYMSFYDFMHIIICNNTFVMLKLRKKHMYDGALVQAIIAPYTYMAILIYHSHQTSSVYLCTYVCEYS